MKQQRAQAPARRQLRFGLRGYEEGGAGSKGGREVGACWKKARRPTFSPVASSTARHTAL